MIASARAAVELRFVDPRRFGQVRCLPAATLHQTPPFLDMGPEPLARAFTAAHLERALAGSRRAIKTALLDQRVVAGVGNIYASEALFAAAIDPRRPAGALRPDELAALVRSLRGVLRRAIRNRGTTFDAYRDANGDAGANQRTLRVFGRTGAPCPRCRQPIARLLQTGRSTFLCVACQV